jgi:hypothetical protein
MQMQLQMMQIQQPPLGPPQQPQQPPPVEPSSPQPPPEDPAAAAKARAAVDAMERYTPPAAGVLAAPAGSRPTTAVSPEYREALDAALNDLPKVFVAKGEKGKSHKVRLWRPTVGLGALPRSSPRETSKECFAVCVTVASRRQGGSSFDCFLCGYLRALPACTRAQCPQVREEVDLMSAEHGAVKAGDQVLVEAVATALNGKGNEVDRYRIGAPLLGWITADNFKLVTKNNGGCQKTRRILPWV